LTPVTVGGPFTVTLNVVVAVRPPPSVTINVIVATPLCVATGVTVTVRDAPEPPKTTLATGTSVVLLDAPDTISDATAVKSSPTVKGSEDVDVPRLMS